MADLHKAIRAAAKGKGHRLEWPKPVSNPAFVETRCSRCGVAVVALADGTVAASRAIGAVVVWMPIPPCRRRERGA